MNYQIFIPGAVGANQQVVDGVGLGEVCGTFRPSMMEVQCFKALNREGVLLNWSSERPDDPPPTYDPSWNWQDAGEYWVGFDPANRPNPNDLKRKKMYAGTLLTLRDGQAWMVPSYSRFEHVWGLENGELTQKPAPQFERYMEDIRRVQNDIFVGLDMVDFIQDRDPDFDPDDDEQRVMIKDGVRIACNALAINYRLNTHIAVALGLIDDQCLNGILATSIDLPEIIDTRQEKKNRFDVAVPVT